MRKSYQGKHLRRLAAVICAALTAGTLGFAPVLYAHPILDSKDAAVSIATNGNVMDITSTAQDNLIKWVDFSISSGKTVDFHDKNYLNYVTGSAVSDIQGILKGTGNIYLVNPNGILIGDGATINVGNLYLSTKNLTDAQLADYTTATSALSAASIADGDVINLGTLKANSVTVEGNNITFKNVADVNNGSAANVKLTANSGGEIHIGSAEGGDLPAYAMSGTDKKYMNMYRLVNDATELQAMKDNLAGNYMLAGNIDMSGVSGFTPIGKNLSEAFTGRFDGLSYEIQNLVINKDGMYVGLFGAVKKATIENLRLVDGSIGGDTSKNVGGIVGYAADSSRIRNVWHTGTVEGESSVGGIVGQAVEGTVIENAYNTGTVTGKGKVGGIVGYSYGSNQIKSAYNTGDVTATHVVNGNDGVGGIAGFNKGSIENAYNTGKVTGNQFVGGIAGNNSGSKSGEGQISHVYNTGEIVGTGDNAINIGGIVGLNTDASTPYAKVSYAYNSGKVTGKDYVGGIVGKNYDYVEHAYNDGNVMGTSNVNGIIGGLDNGGHAATDTYGSAAALFAAWGADTDGTKSTAVWRQYGNNLPILTAFLTRKDNITSRTEYNGGADVGATYTATTYSDAEAQNGSNYIKDVSIVTPKDVTVSFGDISKTYDGTTNATAGTGTLTGIVNSDVVSLADGVMATYTDKTAGEGKTVNYSGLALTGDRAKNYNLVNAATAMGKGTITAKEITAIFADVSKTYDGATSVTAGTGSSTGIVTGDTVTITGTANFTDKNVGANKTVKYTGVTLGGTDAGNYTVAATAEGKGDITAKEITAIFADVSKTYDGATSVTAGTGSSTGIVTGDTVTITGTANFADKNVGTNKTVNYTGVALSGTDAANYSLVSNTATGKGSIAKANITISTAAVTKTYDGTTTVPSTAAKVISGQIFSGDVISGGTFAFTDKNAGTNKTVTVSNVTVDDGNSGGNYNVTYAANTASTINQKEAQVTFDPTTKTYDGTTSATPGEAEFWGLIDADKGKVGVTADAAYTDKNVGTGKRVKYTNITLTGAEAQNYHLTQTDVNANNGTITRKALSLEATPQTITEGEATPTEWSGSVTGFVAGEGLDANDTLSFALDNPAAAAVGSYKVTGTLSIDGVAPLTSGDYGTNYTFDNAAANATAFTIAAKYVPPVPTPTPSAPSGGNGGNTSGTGANTPAPLAAAEPVIVAAVTETETIAAAATAGATAEMSHIADNVRPTNIAEQPANSGGNAAAAPLATAGETAANAQGFTLTAGGLLAISNETNSAPKDAMSPESIGHALSVLQHGSGEKSAATASNTETKSAAGSIGGLEEAVEATDLAIGTEIAETDRESGAGQENLASDTGTAGGADESAEESKEKKKQQ